MAETILVTGANGFIGARLVAALRERGDDVRTHSSCDGDIAAGFAPKDDVSAVVHLAARSFVPESWEQSADYYRVNVLGTIRVLEFCRSRQVRMVYVSTYVYGQPAALPIREDHPRSAMNPYHHSKMLAEDACFFYSEQFRIPVAVVRPFNIYGPGQDDRFVIPMLMRQALASNVVEISLADLRPRRDYLYVEDFTRFMLSLIEHRATGPYNAGTGLSISVKELVDEIGRVAGSQKPVVCRNELRQNELLDVRADIEKARRDLGWTPRVGLAEGLGHVRDAMTACPR